MAAELLKDLPGDLPSFLKRFGTDAKCRAYLVRARWPVGFRCTGCGHDLAYSHKKRLIEECTACGKQHSILAGTIFEQTKTGLATWFLAIYLVTSSKGGISAMELKRQMGFGSYQTAWSWLHKIRKAMVRPERPPLSQRVEADETYVGGPRPGTPGRGAAGKTRVAGAVETGRGQARGRRLGRLRFAVVPDVSAKSLEGFLAGAAHYDAAQLPVGGQLAHDFSQPRPHRLVERVELVVVEPTVIRPIAEANDREWDRGHPLEIGRGIDQRGQPLGQPVVPGDMGGQPAPT